MKKIILLLILCIIPLAYADLNTNLAHVYAFNQTSGELVDYVGSAHGTDSSIVDKSATGINGGAWDFEASSTNYADLGTGVFPTGDADRCFSVWVTKESNPGGGNSLILTTDQTGTQFRYGIVGANDQENLYVLHDNAVSTGADGIYLTNWVHVVVSYENANNYGSVWINGSLIVNESFGVQATGSYEVTIGSENGGHGNSWDGVIDELYVYERSCGQEDVNSLYNSGAGNFYPFIDPDTSAPAFSDMEKNQSNVFENSNVRFNVTITDQSEDSYKFFWNVTGSLVNDTASSYTSGQAVSTTKSISYPKETNICWGYWANDTEGFTNTTEIECFSVSNALPEVTVLHPVLNTAYNVTQGINFTGTDSDGDSLTYRIFINDVLNMSGLTSNVTEWNASDGNYTLIVEASDGMNYTNSSPVTFTYDTEFPRIIINRNNFFNSTNTSNANQYNNTLQANLTIEDNLALYAFNLLVIHPNGTVYYNYTNESLSGYSIWNFTNVIDASTWPNNTRYNIQIDASDPHTAKAIKDYQINKKPKEIKFTTAEGNEVTLDTLGNSNFNHKKKTDRYEFDISFQDKNYKKRTVNIRSKSKIVYLPDSPYLGHFVIGSASGGNWLDLEGDIDNLEVTKISDTHYRVTFYSYGDVSFRSIGGLNTFHAVYSWYKGGYDSTQNPSPVFSEQSATVTLNITKDELTDDINATLVLNGTHYTSVTETSYATYSTYAVTVPGIDVNSDTNLTYYWNVSVSQDNGEYHLFNTHDFNYLITYWDIDDCTNYTVPLFNISVKDEKTTAPVISNSSYTITYYLEGYPSVTKNYQGSTFNTSLYTFCSKTNTSLKGDISAVIEASGYLDRNFNEWDTQLTGVFTAYLLDSASGTSITFNLIDSGGNYVDGAIMRIYRDLNFTPTLIFSGSSDFAGQVVVPLDQTYTYDFSINATGFPFKEFSLQPVSTTYTITLTGEGSNFYNSNYEGVRFRVLHNGQVGLPDIFNLTNEYQNISFEVEGTGLESIGMNLSGHSYVCSPTDCEDSLTTTTGGKVTVQIKANESGVFSTAFYFKPQNKDRIYVNDGLIKVVPFLFAGTDSLIDLIADLKTNTSQNTRSILLAFISLIAIGIGSAFGLFGYALILPVVVVNVIASIPEVGLINPLLGMIVSIFGIVMLVFSEMRNS